MYYVVYCVYCCVCTVYVYCIPLLLSVKAINQNNYLTVPLLYTQHYLPIILNGNHINSRLPCNIPCSQHSVRRNHKILFELLLNYTKYLKLETCCFKLRKNISVFFCFHHLFIFLIKMFVFFLKIKF